LGERPGQDGKLARFFRIALVGVFTNKMSINSQEQDCKMAGFCASLKGNGRDRIASWQDGKIFQNSPCWCYHHQEWYEKNYVIAEPLLVFSPTR
jgi:hypothetical protein